ncbi:MAG: SWIM zinc finger family protein [Thermoproteales archaeon]|nr:SWIM zinc finger family protein [Thermoproteales archaeon]
MKKRVTRDYSEKILKKAELLIKEGRVIRINQNFFYIIGDHGKYFVEVREANIRCTCPGFRNRGFCSHSIAVLLTVLREDYAKTLDEAMKKRLQRNLEMIKRGEIPR